MSASPWLYRGSARTNILDAPDKTDGPHAARAMRCVPQQLLRNSEWIRYPTSTRNEKRSGIASDISMAGSTYGTSIPTSKSILSARTKRPINEHPDPRAAPSRLTILRLPRQLHQLPSPLPHALAQEHHALALLAIRAGRDRERVALRPAPPAHARREHLHAHVLPRAPARAERRDRHADGAERGDGAEVRGGEARLREPQEAVEEVEREGGDDVGRGAAFVEGSLRVWLVSCCKRAYMGVVLTAGRMMMAARTCEK